MKLTEELLKEMEKKKELYGDGIIMPDGDYRLIQDGHLKTLMALLPYTENEIWKMIPEDDSALFWLVEKTGCVLTDVNSAIGMKMTPAQQKLTKHFPAVGSSLMNTMTLPGSEKKPAPSMLQSRTYRSRKCSQYTFTP